MNEVDTLPEQSTVDTLQTEVGTDSTQPNNESNLGQKQPLAEGLNQDQRLPGIKEDLLSEWRKENGGSEWVTNPDGTMNLSTNFQEWAYGPNEAWKNGKIPSTLDSRIDDRFRANFPEDAAKYDEMEKVRVYDDSSKDPAIFRIEADILKQTNNDPEVARATSGQNNSGESLVEIIDKVRIRQQFTAYREFANQYPEKAVAYADSVPMIASILKMNDRDSKEQTLINPEQSPNLEKNKDSLNIASESDIDPREYFRGTAFQKDAEEMDPNKSNPWKNSSGDGTLISDEYGQVAMSNTFDADEVNEDNKLGLLIAEKGKDGDSSIHIKNELNPGTRRQILDVINEVAPRLTGEIRHKFVRTIISLVPSLENQSEDVIAETLTTLALKLLPDHSQGIEATEIPQIGTANPEQQDQLNRLMKLVSKKITPEIFSQKLAELQRNVPFIDGAFESNYSNLLTGIRSWALESRDDTKINHESSRRKELAQYDLSDKITNDFESQEQLETILKALPPAEQMPQNIQNMPKEQEKAEMVQLESVVGGKDMSSWSISTTDNRGLGKILEFAKDLKSGEANIAGFNQPIAVLEMNGKYYLEEGRHRAAALKALGVKETPMLVTHVKTQY